MGFSMNKVPSGSCSTATAYSEIVPENGELEAITPESIVPEVFALDAVAPAAAGSPAAAGRRSYFRSVRMSGRSVQLAAAGFSRRSEEHTSELQSLLRI